MNITGIKRKGVALISSIFIAIVGVVLIMSMMAVSSSNTNQITDDKSGTTAYYAAEAGLEEVKNIFNSDISNLGVPLTDLDLPKQDSESILSNNASYWVDSINYSNSNKSALVYIIGNYGDAFRKIRAKMDTTIPDIYNDYGLLTNGVLAINGNKTLLMNVHANDGFPRDGGLAFGGETTMGNNVVATQSINPLGGTPNSEYNPIGGYTPRIDVPTVPIAEYRTRSQSDGITLNISTLTQEQLRAAINNAPAYSNIYITGSDRHSELCLSDDMKGKFIFVDGDINVSAQGTSNLSNVMVVAAGNMTVDGSGDIDVSTSHDGQTDTIFASGGDISLNGSRSFQSLFWTNQIFTQNGASLAGRVISHETILINGTFTLSQSNKLYDNGAFEKTVNVSSWQVVPVDS